MLNAQDLNNKVDELANKFLIPKGFKKDRLRYYKIDGPNYYGLIKDTSRSIFNDYFLVYSHECLGNFHEKLCKNPSSRLMDYPVSVNINDLKIIYDNNKTPISSPYYFYSLSRAFNVNNKCIESQKTWLNYSSYTIERNDLLISDENYLNNFVTEIFQIIQDYGFRFYKDCDLLLCYRSIKRPIKERKKKQYMFHYQERIEDIYNYLKKYNIEVNANSLLKSKGSSWIHKIIRF